MLVIRSCITVLAEDGETEERYQLNLVKEDVSGLAYLTNLAIEGDHFNS